MYISIFNSILHFFWTWYGLVLSKLEILDNLVLSVCKRHRSIHSDLHVYVDFQRQLCLFVLLRSCDIRIGNLRASWSYVFNCFMTSKHRSIHSAFMLFMCIYISIFKVNSTFLSWCYGLALSGLKSWHLGLKLQVFNRCLWTTHKHKSIHSAFMGSFDITQVLGSLKNPYIDWVEQHKSVFLDGMRQQLEAWSLWNRTWPARFLEDGRISPQIVHLEGKRLLADY